MLVTNQTTADIYFGPLHLPAGIGQTLTVDDTSATSLYLLNDSVADALNNAYAAARISVSDQAEPFPRPTGTPQLLHGLGDPEGLVYAAQGSLYMRQDGLTSNGGGLYVKMSGVTSPKDWTDIATASGATAALPAGVIIPFGSISAPDGWLACDGSAVSRTTYSTLFGVISTNYGPGDGSSTFNVPDLRGRIPVGQFSGGKTEVATLGNNEGLNDTNASKRSVAHIHYLGSAQASGSGGGWVPYLTAANQYNGKAMSGDADNVSNPAYLVLGYIIKT